MKYKDWMKLINKRPHKDLNGIVVAYDIDGTALGEIVYKDGEVISGREYTVEERAIYLTNKEGKDDNKVGNTLMSKGDKIPAGAPKQKSRTVGKGKATAI